MSLARLEQVVFSTIDARPLALVRMVLALAALGVGVEVWVKALRVFAPNMLVTPLVAGMPRLSPALVPAFIGVWGVLAILLLLGMWSRAASAWLCAACSYVLCVDQQLYSNHLYLLATLLLLLTCSDSGACWSLDARRAGTRPHVPAWPVWLIKLQISVVYGFAALAKINTVYLEGAVIKSQFVLPSVFFLSPEAWNALLPFLAVLSIAVEGFLAIALWSARWRVVALLAGIGLHGFIVVAGSITPFTALELANFALITMAPYVLFFGSSLPKVPRVAISHNRKKDD